MAVNIEVVQNICRLSWDRIARLSFVPYIGDSASRLAVWVSSLVTNIDAVGVHRV